MMDAYLTKEPKATAMVTSRLYGLVRDRRSLTRVSAVMMGKNKKYSL